MVDAVVGGVIMVVATTSLLLAIDVAERAMNSAGRFCLTDDEKIVLGRAGLPASETQEFWIQNVRNAPTHLSDGKPMSIGMSAQECK